MPFDSPSTTDPHPDWHDLLAGYALGNLSSEEHATLQTLLAKCPDLQAEVQAYEEALAMVPYGLELEMPPPELEQSIFQAIDTQPPRVQQPLRRQWLRWKAHLTAAWYPATLATAAAVILLGGVDNYRLRQQRTLLAAQLTTMRTERQTLATTLEQLEQQYLNQRSISDRFEQVVNILRQPNALVYSLRGVEAASTSSGSLLTLPDHSEVQLVSHDLPVLPQGQVYRLWSVATETANPMFCGQFNNTVLGNVQWTVPDTRCNASPARVMITVDAVVDPPVPKGPAVLTGEF